MYPMKNSPYITRVYPNDFNRWDCIFTSDMHRICSDTTLACGSPIPSIEYYVDKNKIFEKEKEIEIREKLVETRENELDGKEEDIKNRENKLMRMEENIKKIIANFLVMRQVV